MNAVKAKWENGQVILDGHVNWPEGSRLVVAPETLLDDAERTEEDRADDPAAIARWIAEFEAIPPIEMTEQEEADWQDARQAQRELEKASCVSRAEKLQRAFE